MFLSDLQGYCSTDVRTIADIELNIISSSTCRIFQSQTKIISCLTKR